jgi:acetyltransferase-like isoleucine patch superfamily enzyme
MTRFTLNSPYAKYKEFKIRHIGTNCQFNAKDKGLIHIEQEAYFGDNCSIYAVGSSVRIGERVKMANYVFIFAAYHDTYDREKMVQGPVKIGNDVWIGEGAKIMKGVLIADNCTIGANAVVTKSIPHKYTVVGGAPAELLYIAKENKQ